MLLVREKTPAIVMVYTTEQKIIKEKREWSRDGQNEKEPFTIVNNAIKRTEDFKNKQQKYRHKYLVAMFYNSEREREREKLSALCATILYRSLPKPRIASLPDNLPTLSLSLN